MNVMIRPLKEKDLAEAGRIVGLAFGTFIGVPEPETFRADRDYARTRWRADPSAAFGAELDGVLVGSNFATQWGSVAFFGPLTVRPDLWDQGLGKRLMEPVMSLFDAWGVSHAGLFTFAHSPKHVRLYQRYGFWPRALTAIMSKPLEPRPTSAAWTRYSELSEDARTACLADCAAVTGALYEGLDAAREIRATQAQSLGDTVLLREGNALAGFGVCHCGAGSEAGTGNCYVNFGAVRPGPEAEARFARLLDACEDLAAARGLTQLVAGVSTARHEAYRAMLARGFRTDIQGVAMHRGNEPGYHRPGVYAIDDWR
jgi:GNAT superfamily N-acetyltransferase